MKKTNLLQAGLVCLLFAFSLNANAATVTFQILSDPITGTWSNFALSADGTVMAANYGGEIYRWSALTGFQDLGPGDPYASSIGISGDGSTIISGSIGSDGFSHPTIWNHSGSVDLGHPSNGCTRVGNSWGSGYSLNADGSAAVGLAWTCKDAEGFIWTPSAGNVSLGHPYGNHSSRASAISANSKTIVGFWEDPTGPRRPVRWIGGTHSLFLGKTALGEATAVSSDGNNIVGQIYNASGNGVAFLYSDKAGLTNIGTIRQSRFEQSVANAISDNGMVIGWSGDPFGHGIDAFLWTSSGGTVKLAKALRQMGAKIPTGMTLSTALSISADGSTMVGEYFDANFQFGTWMVHITK